MRMNTAYLLVLAWKGQEMSGFELVMKSEDSYSKMFGMSLRHSDGSVPLSLLEQWETNLKQKTSTLYGAMPLNAMVG